MGVIWTIIIFVGLISLNVLMVLIEKKNERRNKRYEKKKK